MSDYILVFVLEAVSLAIVVFFILNTIRLVTAESTISEFPTQGPQCAMAVFIPMLLIFLEANVMTEGVTHRGITNFGSVPHTWENTLIELGIFSSLAIAFLCIMALICKPKILKLFWMLLLVATVVFRILAVEDINRQCLEARREIAHYESFRDKTHLAGWYVYWFKDENESTLAEIKELEMK